MLCNQLIFKEVFYMKKNTILTIALIAMGTINAAASESATTNAFHFPEEPAIKYSYQASTTGSEFLDENYSFKHHLGSSRKRLNLLETFYSELSKNDGTGESKISARKLQKRFLINNVQYGDDFYNEIANAMGIVHMKDNRAILNVAISYMQAMKLLSQTNDAVSKAELAYAQYTTRVGQVSTSDAQKKYMQVVQSAVETIQSGNASVDDLRYEGEADPSIVGIMNEAKAAAETEHSNAEAAIQLLIKVAEGKKFSSDEIKL